MDGVGGVGGTGDVGGVGRLYSSEPPTMKTKSACAADAGTDSATSSSLAVINENWDASDDASDASDDDGDDKYHQDDASYPSDDGDGG